MMVISLSSGDFRVAYLPLIRLLTSLNSSVRVCVSLSTTSAITDVGQTMAGAAGAGLEKKINYTAVETELI